MSRQNLIPTSEINRSVDTYVEVVSLFGPVHPQLWHEYNNLKTENANLRGENLGLKKENSDLNNRIIAIVDNDLKVLQSDNDFLRHENAKLNEEVTNLKAENIKLNYEIALLRAENTKLNDEIVLLQAENKSLRARIDALEKKNESLDKKNESLDKKNESLQHQVDTLGKKNESLDKKNESLQHQIDALQTEKEDTTLLNEFTDIFRYFRDRRLPDMKDAHSISFSAAFNERDHDALLKPINIYERNGIATDPRLKDVRTLLQLFDLDLETAMNLVHLNRDRNYSTHSFDIAKYKDPVFMSKVLSNYKAKLIKLHPQHYLHGHKADIIRLIDALCKDL